MVKTSCLLAVVPENPPPLQSFGTPECQTHRCRVVEPQGVRCVFGVLEDLEERLRVLEERR